MTTKVTIRLDEQNHPVVVETLRKDGSVQHTAELFAIGDTTSEYVHSGQTIHVREMTTEEMHHRGLAIR